MFRWWKQYSHSSFPFSLPRSFLSFLGFLGVPSSPGVTTDRRLEPPERPEAPVGPGVNARGGTGRWPLELGVGGISPSVRAWYGNSDFSKNLKTEIRRLSEMTKLVWAEHNSWLYHFISYISKVRQRSSKKSAGMMNKNRKMTKRRSFPHSSRTEKWFNKKQTHTAAIRMLCTVTLNKWELDCWWKHSVICTVPCS